MVEQFKTAQPDALILLQHVDDPRAFGVAELDGERVVQLEEKPAEPKSDLALVGVYMFQPGIFDICRTLEPSGRGEYEITEAIQTLIDQGKRVEPHVVTGWWKDTGKWEDMLETNRLLLDAVEPAIDGEVVDSELEGRVAVAAGARLERCRVQGPVAIGEGAVLKDAYIGPYTAVAEGCEIERAEIENSIILENSRITDLHHRLEGSLDRPERRHRRPELEAERVPDPRRRRLAHRHPVIEGVQRHPAPQVRGRARLVHGDPPGELDAEADGQTNVSFSRRGVIRGLHYHERGQDDLFVCLSGMARVVLLDLETDETFSVDIGDDNPVAVYVPGRLAHGFEALTDVSSVTRSPRSTTRTIRTSTEVPWNDPRVRHLWSTQSPILSERDAAAAS